MSNFLVGVDAGITGCRSIVFDLDGNVLGQDYREHPCVYPGPGFVEQCYEDTTLLLTNSCWEAIAASGISPEKIWAVAFPSQAPPLVPVNTEGNLIRDFLSWQNLWGAPCIPKLWEAYGVERFYLETGDPLGTNNAAPKWTWLCDNELENWVHTEWFLSKQESLLKEQGVDGYWTDLSPASREGVLDVDSIQWSRGIHDLIGVPAEKRAHPVTSPGKVVRRIGKDIACRAGLAKGAPLYLGAHDQNRSTFGRGAVRGGDCVMVMGTFGSCYVVMDEPLRDPAWKLVVKPSHGMENWTIEAFSDTSAFSLRWYRDTLCREECAVGGVAGVGPYDIITSQARRSPVGANGATSLPYLAGAPGVHQNPQVRTNTNGMTLATTKGDAARVVPERIYFEMRDILDVQAAAGIEAGIIRLVGGVVKSVLWPQMPVDVFQRPIEILHTSEADYLGTAVYAGVGAGLYSSCEEAVAWAVAVVGRFDPDSAVRAAYDQALKRLVDLYESLDTGVFRAPGDTYRTGPPWLGVS